jgi:hypothetical protein
MCACKHLKLEEAAPNAAFGRDEFNASVFKGATTLYAPYPHIPCMAQDRVCTPVLLVAILPMEIRSLHRLDI